MENRVSNLTKKEIVRIFSDFTLNPFKINGLEIPKLMALDYGKSIIDGKIYQRYGYFIDNDDLVAEVAIFYNYKFPYQLNCEDKKIRVNLKKDTLIKLLSLSLSEDMNICFVTCDVCGKEKNVDIKGTETGRYISTNGEIIRVIALNNPVKLDCDCRKNNIINTIGQGANFEIKKNND
jgi:hypothetical protein